MANITAKNELSTNVRYSIEDGTGAIDATQWSHQETETDDEASKRELFAPGSFVKIIGIVRVFNNKKSIFIHHMKLVENLDEISYHQLYCMYVYTFLTKGPLSQRFKNDLSATGPYVQQQQGLYGNNLLPSNTSHYSPLQQQVLSTLKTLDNGAHVDGVKFEDVCFALRGLATDQDIKQVLDFFMNESLVYTTCDDETFKVS